MAEKKNTPAEDPADAPKVAENPLANEFTNGAQERIATLRRMAAEVPDDDPRPLTPAEIRLARHTSMAALEKAALFVEAAPGIGGELADTALYRRAIAHELAHGGERDEAYAYARHVDHAILRLKLKAVRAARGLYKIAKGYVTVDAGDSVRLHVEEMKRTLVRPRRKKPAPPADPEAETEKKK